MNIDSRITELKKEIEAPSDQALECIVTNWLIWGYKDYPNVVFITTPKK